MPSTRLSFRGELAVAIEDMVCSGKDLPGFQKLVQQHLPVPDRSGPDHPEYCVGIAEAATLGYFGENAGIPIRILDA